MRRLMWALGFEDEVKTKKTLLHITTEQKEQQYEEGKDYLLWHDGDMKKRERDEKEKKASRMKK